MIANQTVIKDYSTMIFFTISLIKINEKETQPKLQICNQNCS